MVTTPQRNERTLKLRENARELSDAEWPEEEKTNPVIVQVMTSPEKPQVTASDIEKGANAAATVFKALPSTWPPIVGILILTIGAVAIYWLKNQP